MPKEIQYKLMESIKAMPIWWWMWEILMETKSLSSEILMEMIVRSQNLIGAMIHLNGPKGWKVLLAKK